MQHHHIVTAILLALGTGLLAAPPAFSQMASGNDVAYCNALSGVYNRYLGDSSLSMETISAEANCNNGRVAQAIPELEKLLRSKGYPLPQH
jgi:hypothetical protein